uniref:Uncharacterized protein n=1 Tax=Trichogramma kaykai TaxID=54128 RepID=A0ABD2W1B6_9HYME
MRYIGGGVRDLTHELGDCVDDIEIVAFLGADLRNPEATNHHRGSRRLTICGIVKTGRRRHNNKKQKARKRQSDRRGRSAWFSYDTRASRRSRL